MDLLDVVGEHALCPKAEAGEQTDGARQVAGEQIQPLVGGEPPREAEGESIRIERVRREVDVLHARRARGDRTSPARARTRPARLPIGTSRSRHIARATSPWRRLTPLAA